MMRSIFLATTLAAGAMALSGCGEKSANESKAKNETAKGVESPITAQSPAQKIADAYLAEMTRIADALDTVKDEDSAAAAAGVIQSAAATLDAMSDELEGGMNEKIMTPVMLARQQEFTQIQTRLAMSMTRLGMTRPDLMEKISEAMDELPQPE